MLELAFIPGAKLDLSWCSLAQVREKRQILCLSPEKSINEEERSFYRLMSYAKKKCQDLQILTFVALFSAILGAKSGGLFVVLEKRAASL